LNYNKNRQKYIQLKLKGKLKGKKLRRREQFDVEALTFSSFSQVFFINKNKKKQTK